MLSLFVQPEASCLSRHGAVNDYVWGERDHVSIHYAEVSSTNTTA